MNEFSIIKHYFSEQSIHRDDVILGIGDDCAILQPPNQQLAITIDTLVAGIHFPISTSAFDIGYKALAVNLSDLAAMGATPAWITLALTLPKYDDAWLHGFSQGLLTLAKKYNVQLIGGDTTRGPLTITIQACGFVPHDQALSRNKAIPGDYIYVTHTLGDAAAAIHLYKQKLPIASSLLNRLNRPEPQIAIGKQLRGQAHAMIDISDGLAADLSHILEQSRVGALVYVDHIPLSVTLLQHFSSEDALTFALNGGDDYELCFTTPHEISFDDCTCIGRITEAKGLDLRFSNGMQYLGRTTGYQHF